MVVFGGVGASVFVGAGIVGFFSLDIIFSPVLYADKAIIKEQTSRIAIAQIKRIIDA